MAYLVLVRHGQSEWNAQGLWTGWRDVPLSSEGFAEARRAGEALRDIPLDLGYTSALTRAQQTLDEIKRTLGREDLPVIADPALNERDYGDLTGKNKWKILEEYGEEQFLKWRRSWDYPVPGGETLKDVYARVVPYYEHKILPQLREGRNVIIAAHGNSLRALVKYLENISDADIPKLEIGTGEVYIYQVDPQGRIVGKEIRAVNEARGRQ
jgi:2,3-bisphosphoglycerate-dependent phosphoglycerate mutase